MTMSYYSSTSSNSTSPYINTAFYNDIKISLSKVSDEIKKYKEERKKEKIFYFKPENLDI